VYDTRHEYDRITQLYLPIAIAVVGLVLLLVVVLTWRYRARPDDAQAGRRPSRLHSAPKTEGLYVLVLAGVAALLLWKTFTVEARTDRDDSGAQVRIDVTAAKWHWRFDYPREGIVQQGGDLRPATLVVPAGRRIGFRLTSVDVIHAFWIPARRFKRDANPSLTSTFTLVFPKPGFTRGGGECSEFCGLHHAQMHFDVLVLTPAAYARWLTAHRRAGTRAAATVGGAR
jgi:cytochrome c oxidase subunit II